MLAALSSLASSDRPLDPTFETQGLSSTTGVETTGIFTNQNSVVQQFSNLDLLDDPPLDTPYPSDQVGDYYIVWNLGPLFPIGPGETSYVVSYSDDTLASQGMTTFQKQLTLDTQARAVDQDNLWAEKLIGFEGTATGKVTSVESLAVDGAAQFDRGAGGGFLCPFAYENSQIVGPYCNIVEMGSRFDLSSGMVYTSASERTIAKTWDVPVEADYQIDVAGMDTLPALGSVSASIRSHVQEGDMRFLGSYGFDDFSLDVYHLDKRADLTYSEKTEASGAIVQFQKAMHYESGRRR